MPSWIVIRSPISTHADESVIEDLDTPADYERLRARHGPGVGFGGGRTRCASQRARDFQGRAERLTFKVAKRKWGFQCTVVCADLGEACDRLPFVWASWRSWRCRFSPGCGKPAADAKAELEKLKKKEKPKPPFDRLKVFVEPSDKEALSISHRVKPGHWTGVLVETKANHFDFSGDLDSSAARRAVESARLGE